VHFLSAIWALIWLGGPPALQLGTNILHWGSVGYVVGAVGIMWVLNLFNFMDGIDGIAASEAVFIALSGAMLCVYADMRGEVSVASVVFGAACAGFLVWNWPPAKIFMGDVGSGYLGYVVAVLALTAARKSPGALWSWLILGGVFLVDASVTLVRRLFRGERVSEAHRNHAYQRLARSWKGHSRVTLAVIACNLLWLLPCAFLAAAYPQRGAWIACAALAPLLVVAVAAGAGGQSAK